MHRKLWRLGLGERSLARHPQNSTLTCDPHPKYRRHIGAGTSCLFLYSLEVWKINTPKPPAWEPQRNPIKPFLGTALLRLGEDRSGTHSGQGCGCVGRGVYGLQIGFKHCLPFNKIWLDNVIFEPGNGLSQRLATRVRQPSSAFHSHTSAGHAKLCLRGTSEA